MSKRLMAAFSIIVFATGCKERSPSIDNNHSTVRDSAGVRIVEHASGLPSDVERWRLADTPILEIGAQDQSDAEFNGVAQAVQMSRHGIVAVVWTSANTPSVRAFDSTGRFLWKQGTIGDGPGDYRQIEYLSVGRGDSIFIFDVRLQRITVLTSTGVVAKTISIAAIDNGWLKGTMLDHSMIVSFESHEHEVMRDRHGWPRLARVVVAVAADGQRIDTIGKFLGWPLMKYSDGTFSEVPDLRYPFILAARESSFVFGDADRYQWSVFDRRGHLHQVVRWNRPLGRLSRAAHTYYTKEGYAKEPEFMKWVELFRYPAFDQVRIDDIGNVWLRNADTVDYEPPPQLNRLPPPWTVFRPDGRILAVADFARPGFTLIGVAHDRVIGTIVNEAGFYRILVYRIEKTESR